LFPKKDYEVDLHKKKRTFQANLRGKKKGLLPNLDCRFHVEGERELLLKTKQAAGESIWKHAGDPSGVFLIAREGSA